MYTVEKSKQNTQEPWQLRRSNYSMTLEEFYGPNLVDITGVNSSFAVFNDMVFDSC